MMVTGRSVPSTQLEPPQRERSRSAPPINVRGEQKDAMAYSVYGDARREAHMQVWGESGMCKKNDVPHLFAQLAPPPAALQVPTDA